jgi:superfamily II DNA or RNA helicase
MLVGADGATGPELPSATPEARIDMTSVPLHARHDAAMTSPHPNKCHEDQVMLVGADGATGPELPSATPEARIDMTSVPLHARQDDMVRVFGARLKEGRGCMCLDGVGCGKTLGSLATALSVARVVYVACPRTLIAHWVYTARELAGMHVDQVTYGAKASTERTRVHITSYDRLPDISNPTHERRVIILDEAHVLRNPTTKLYKTISGLLAQNPTLMPLALTATPIYNSIDDARALLALVLRHPLEHPVPAAEVTRAVMRRALPDGGEVPHVELLDHTIPLRRGEVMQYKDVLEMSKPGWPFTIGRYVSHSQHDHMMEIDQDKHRIGDFRPSSKEARMLDIISEHLQRPGGTCHSRVVVASQSIPLLRHAAAIAGALIDNLKQCLVLTGSTCDTDHTDMLKHFNGRASGTQALFITTKANSEGISLTGATCMILMDTCSHFSPQCELQMIGRVRRPGLLEPLVVHRLRAMGTCDELIPQVFHQDKTRKSDAFLCGEYAGECLETEHVGAAAYLHAVTVAYQDKEHFAPVVGSWDERWKRCALWKAGNYTDTNLKRERKAESMRKKQRLLIVNKVKNAFKRQNGLAVR